MIRSWDTLLTDLRNGNYIGLYKKCKTLLDMTIYLDKDTVCTECQLQSWGHHSRFQDTCRSCVRWLTHDSQYTFRCESHRYQRDRCTRTVDSEGSSRNQVHTLRRFCRRCWDDTYIYRSWRHRNCREHRYRHSRRVCNLRVRNCRCRERTGHSDGPQHLAYTDSYHRSSYKSNCAIQLGYTRKL